MLNGFAVCTNKRIKHKYTWEADWQSNDPMETVFNFTTLNHFFITSRAGDCYCTNVWKQLNFDTSSVNPMSIFLCVSIDQNHWNKTNDLFSQWLCVLQNSMFPKWIIKVLKCCWISHWKTKHDFWEHNNNILHLKLCAFTVHWLVQHNRTNARSSLYHSQQRKQCIIYGTIVISWPLLAL